MKTLRPSQVNAIEFIRDHGYRAGVFMQAGSGKTLTAVHCIDDFDHALIIARRDDYMTWSDELIGAGYHHDDIYRIESGNDDIPDPLPPVVMVTYDLVKRRHQAFMSAGFDIAVMDECQMLRGPTTARTKRLIKVADSIPHRLMLTATPYGNDISDFWGQTRCIDGGAVFGTTFWTYRKRYQIRAGPGWVDKRGSRELIAQQLKRVAFSTLTERVIDLPKRRYVKLGFPMSAAQRAQAERVVSQWEYTLNSTTGQMDLDRTIEQHNVLRQIASGFVYDHTWSDDNVRMSGPPRWIKCPKFEGVVRWIREFLSTTNDKLVVWAAHRAEVARLGRVFTDVGVTFAGTPKRRDGARTAFRDDPKCRLFISNPDRGVGMNELVAANTVLYLSNSPKATSRYQSETRTWRPGSERHDEIVYYDAVTEGSLDVDVLAAVRENLDYAAYVARKLQIP